MFTFPTNTLSAARRGQLAHVSREWLENVARGIDRYPGEKYTDTARKIARQLEREPDRDMFFIAYASHTQRRNAEYLAHNGRI